MVAVHENVDTINKSLEHHNQGQVNITADQRTCADPDVRVGFLRMVTSKRCSLHYRRISVPVCRQGRGFLVSNLRLCLVRRSVLIYRVFNTATQLPSLDRLSGDRIDTNTSF